MFNFYFKNHWLFSFLGAFLILVLSLMPSGPANPLSWFHILYLDKIAHLLVYFIWSFALICSFSIQYLNKGLRYLNVLLPFVITMLYGAAMEFLQLYFTSDRVGEWQDLGANAIGCCLGLGAYFIVKERIKALK